MYHQKAFKIKEKALPPNNSKLAIIYNNVGMAYNAMNEPTKALQYFGMSLEIAEQLFPLDHVGLFVNDSIISEIYFPKGESSKALATVRKCFDIEQASPGINLHTKVSFRSGKVFYCMSNYSKALGCFKQALELAKQAIPGTDEFFGIIYSNIGNVQQLPIWPEHTTIWVKFIKG